MSELDPVAGVLLGGIGGAVVSQFIQLARDELSARWRLRGAARIVRSEVVRNLAVMEAYKEFGGVPAEETRSLHGHRFERVMDTLASGLLQDEMALLLSHHESLTTANQLLVKAKGRRFTDAEQEWLRNWLKDAYVCQNVAYMRGERFWYRLRHPRDSRRIDADVRALVHAAPPAVRTKR